MLRETKLALDKAINVAPHLHATGNGKSAYGDSRGSRVEHNGVSRRSAVARRIRAHTVVSSTRTVVAQEQWKAKTEDMASPSESSAKRARKPGDTRRALGEIQIDPDLPLPLPTFPGYGKQHLGKGRAVSKCGYCHHHGSSDGTNVVGGRPTINVEPKSESRNRHGYFIPGFIVPRQRQSHGLPCELRAIATVPKPECWSGRKGRRRPRQARLDEPIAVAVAAGIRAPPPPTRAPVNSISGRPTPGSAAAVAAAREQRKQTSRAVAELRKEMREREERLLRELDRFKQQRGHRDAATGVVAANPAASSAATGVPTKNIPKRKSAISAAPRRSYNPAAVYQKPIFSNTRVSRRNRFRTGQATTKRQSSPNPAPDPVTGAQIEKTSGGSSNNSNRVKHAVGQVVYREFKTADAQAQTATDGMQLFLHPTPAPGKIVQDEERRGMIGAGKNEVTGGDHAQHNINSFKRSKGGAGREDNVSAGSSCSLGSPSSGGGALDTVPGIRRVIPPPPVVFIEGDGRNSAWRPSDDDALVNTRGGVGPGATFCLPIQRSEQEEPPTIDDEMAEKVMDAPKREGKGERNAPAPLTQPPRAIRLSTEHLEAFPYPSAAEDDDGWVEIAGLSGLSAAMTTAAAGAGASERPGASGEDEEKAELVGSISTAIAPELLELLREVVGQQRGLGEERSALMQVGA